MQRPRCLQFLWHHTLVSQHEFALGATSLGNANRLSDRLKVAALKQAAHAVEWLPKLFSRVWAPSAVVEELRQGQRRGFDVPNLSAYPWLQVVDPRATPSEWLSLHLGPGELAAMALALENKTHVVLLDDLRARRTAQAAGLMVWGTLTTANSAPVPCRLSNAINSAFLGRCSTASTSIWIWCACPSKSWRRSGSRRGFSHDPRASGSGTQGAGATLCQVGES